MYGMNEQEKEGGRRLKKVSANMIRRTLRKAGIKPKGRMVLKGGAALSPAAVGGESSPAPAGGRRGHRGTRRHHRKSRSRRSLFGRLLR